jgi:lipopolysaccharide transport system permease protein
MARDIRVRYKQTGLGLLWVVLQPLVLTVAFALFLGRVAGIGPDGVSYPVFVLAAVVPWTLISKAVAAASESLVSASALLQKAYFPRLLLPLSAIGSQLVDYLIGLVVLIAVAALAHIYPTPTALSLIPLTALALLVALAAGVWLSATNARHRDVRHVLPLFLQLWLFASPIVYSTQAVPPEWRVWYAVNPMVGVVEAFRWALVDPRVPFPAFEVVAALSVTLTALALGLMYFRHVERGFADVI